MNTIQMKIVDIDVADYNPRVALLPSSAAWKKLEASLDSFGQVEPLIWNERTKRLVGGHQRLAILKHRGDLSAWVTVVDLDEERERVLNLVLNNPEAQSSWDAEKLVSMTDRMSQEAVLLSGFNSAADAHELLRRAEYQSNASFLSEYLHPEPALHTESDDHGEEPTATPRERTPEHDLKEEHLHKQGLQYFEEKLVLDGGQREIYLRAVDRMKLHYGVDNRYEALILHMDAWNRDWDKSHADAGVDS